MSLEVEQLRAHPSSVLDDLEITKAGDRISSSGDNANAHDDNGSSNNKQGDDGGDDAGITASVITNATEEQSADPTSSALAAVNTDGDEKGLFSQQQQQQQEPEERSAEPKEQDQERLIAAEQSRSLRELQADLEVALARVTELERSGSEAMQAAGTEAARAAEAREGLEGAEAELVELRGRRLEWEEEMTRSAELKGTLEVTRDALDELRSVRSSPPKFRMYPRLLLVDWIKGFRNISHPCRRL